MEKIFTIILVGLLFSSCSSINNNEIDCGLYDPLFPGLYIKIVDSAGTNQIENGSIDPDSITVEGDFSAAGFRFVPENEFANPDTDIRKLDNTLFLNIPNQPSFQYTINLSDTQSIDINFTAKLTEISCGITYFTPNGSVYNNESLELNEVSTLQFLAIIEL